MVPLDGCYVLLYHTRLASLVGWGRHWHNLSILYWLLHQDVAEGKTMSDIGEAQRCGTCGWFHKTPRLGSPYLCVYPLPDTILEYIDIRVEKHDGTGCPCWKEKECSATKT